MPTTGKPYRVAQWATGTIGLRALRAALDHPELALAGLYSHSPAKIGRDAGDLCGLPATGIRATDSLAAILELGVDCVLYMPRAFDQETVLALLSAGTNVVTTCGLFHHPPSMDPALRTRIEAACATGGSSIHSTGSSPGFITEALPLTLASVQRRVDSLTIDEYADLSQRDSPAMLFEVMGFGQAPADFDQARADHLGAGFGPSLRLLADAFGIPVDTVTAHGRTATARHRTTIAAGTIEAGTVAAQQITVTAHSYGQAALRFRATWYCTTDLDTDWPLRETGWHLELAGDAPLDIDIRFPIPLTRMAETAPGYTANRAVNAVPALCAAPPGIRTTMDLPHLVGAW
ncbi:dihydrodipicolinate reductase [Nocardia sp. NPDC050712]|uniref:NAD(P)H-dependent amine dehydrogenase family protein n=1 Tax=Nocardia sp. NPDC050712 TaxID=3155518 RepID=UPI0033F7CC7E